MVQGVKELSFSVKRSWTNLKSDELFAVRNNLLIRNFKLFGISDHSLTKRLPLKNYILCILTPNSPTHCLNDFMLRKKIDIYNCSVGPYSA